MSFSMMTPEPMTENNVHVIQNKVEPPSPRQINTPEKVFHKFIKITPGNNALDEITRI